MLRFLVWLVMFVPIFGFGQNGVAHTLYQQFNGPFDYTIIGNTLNPSDTWSFPYPAAGTMLTSTSSILNLAPNQTIVGAYLIWAGISNGANTTLTINGTTFTPDFINV